MPSRRSILTGTAAIFLAGTAKGQERVVFSPDTMFGRRISFEPSHLMPTIWGFRTLPGSVYASSQRIAPLPADIAAVLSRDCHLNCYNSYVTNAQNPGILSVRLPPGTNPLGEALLENIVTQTRTFLSSLPHQRDEHGRRLTSRQVLLRKLNFLACSLDNADFKLLHDGTLTNAPQSVVQFNGQVDCVLVNYARFGIARLLGFAPDHIYSCILSPQHQAGQHAPLLHMTTLVYNNFDNHWVLIDGNGRISGEERGAALAVSSTEQGYNWVKNKLTGASIAAYAPILVFNDRNMFTTAAFDTRTGGVLDIPRVFPSDSFGTITIHHHAVPVAQRSANLATPPALATASATPADLVHYTFSIRPRGFLVDHYQHLQKHNLH